LAVLDNGLRVTDVMVGGEWQGDTPLPYYQPKRCPTGDESKVFDGQPKTLRAARRKPDATWTIRSE
jgi:hypothetical protein